jgi:hypothetical protein
LGIPVAVASRAAILLLVVRVGVLHWHVAVHITVVAVRHGVIARRVSATARGCRESQIGGATRDRRRAVSVVLGRRAASGRVEGCWRHSSGGRRWQVSVWGLTTAGSGVACYCMPRAGREGGGLVRRVVVTRRRRRPDRVAVHRANGSGEEEVQSSEHALGVAGGVARRGVMAHGGCASERAAAQQQQHRTNGPGARAVGQ